MGRVDGWDGLGSWEEKDAMGRKGRRHGLDGWIDYTRMDGGMDKMRWDGAPLREMDGKLSDNMKMDGCSERNGALGWHGVT